MEIIDGKTCISFEELTGRVITTANLKALVRKGQVQQVQRGGNGRVALYAVDSLPMKWRTEVYKRYPDLQEQAESREFMDTVEPDGAAFDFFQSYHAGTGIDLSFKSAMMSTTGRPSLMISLMSISFCIVPCVLTRCCLLPLYRNMAKDVGRALSVKKICGQRGNGSCPRGRE